LRRRKRKSYLSTNGVCPAAAAGAAQNKSGITGGPSVAAASRRRERINNKGREQKKHELPTGRSTPKERQNRGVLPLLEVRQRLSDSDPRTDLTLLALGKQRFQGLTWQAGAMHLSWGIYP